MQVPLNYEKRLKMFKMRIGSCGGSESLDEWTNEKDDKTEFDFLHKAKVAMGAQSSLDGESVTLDDLNQERKDDVVTPMKSEERGN